MSENEGTKSLKEEFVGLFSAISQRERETNASVMQKIIEIAENLGIVNRRKSERTDETAEAL